MSHLRALRDLLAAATATAALTLAPMTLVPTAHADESGSRVAGLGTILDGVIALLPPLPVEDTAYTGEICADGSSACIDATIVRMQDRLDELVETCDHAAIFSLAYLRVTEDVRAALAEGVYADPVWLNRIDAVFAEEYFTTVANWQAGRTDLVPQAWQIALRTEDKKSMTALGNFMLAMNAHINRDFPYVTAEVGVTGPNGVSHKADHDAYNKRLDALLDPVFAEMAARFDPRFDDLDIAIPAAFIMRGWREMVWRHTELLVLARTPAQRKVVEAEIEAYAAAQAQLITLLFSAPNSRARDAWCAQHGRG
ncbi:DUF5995 family protein [Nocardioides sp. AE5]|uniref:DUF5995 family protein n=1 Tax=Nocardioides sp. AE5 TaxID=2962573 RepID=UPI002880E03C|nr:DUF5995 family protein [Nocardioides sp. AE5]MDT0202263.1 DUF5995 family protein [Nocardioides sp. AE5]